MNESLLFPGKKALVVDDMPFMRQLVKGCLLRLGINDPVEAADGKSALILLQRRDVDLIVCDIDMPVMNGIEFLKAVRAEERFQRIKFLMLTATADASIVKEAIASGVDDYIVKPFKPQMLQTKVQRLLTKR